MKKMIMVLSIGLIGLTSCGGGTETKCEGKCDSTKVDSTVVVVDTTVVPTSTVAVDTTK